MADDDLRDELTDIRGIGETKADEIIEIYEEYDGTGPSNEILGDVHDLLEEAIDHFDAGEAFGDVTAQQGIEQVQEAHDLLADEVDDGDE